MKTNILASVYQTFYTKTIFHIHCYSKVIIEKQLKLVLYINTIFFKLNLVYLFHYLLLKLKIKHLLTLY